MTIDEKVFPPVQYEGFRLKALERIAEATGMRVKIALIAA